MADDILQEIRERKDYATNGWQDIRKEGATDMQFVSGDPWDDDDKKHRKGRPTIAPEEMGQYFNQVINQLWANPRGMKFAPTGNGASEAGARFYQNKAREIEYRSHAKIAYITAAADAIQRSYGFVRIAARYASPRSVNQELWIDPMPDPDMVTPDPDAKRADSGDMQYCFVEEWTDQGEFKRTHKNAKIRNFAEWATSHPSWITGSKVLRAEYWTISTRPRKLVLVQPPAPMQPNDIAPSPVPASRPVEVFEDELPKGAQFLHNLRTVDYPQVKMYLTNGLEILHEQDWPGKYIPIVSCYGKVLYVPKGGQTERQILSMTRFGRAPWKAYCYAASQQLEVISMIPKAPFMVPRGTFPGALATAVQESMHTPKAFLEYDPKPNNQLEPNGPPMHADYPAGQHLQALEVVKEGFRRAIQSAMGSNFLPSEAQRHNEKSGVALDKITQAASTGTFHFVNNYEDMIRQVGVVIEDLIDKYYDFAGETGVMDADGTAQTVQINSDHDEAVNTKGDYLLTVSTGPSSDSERQAVQEFTDSLVGNLERIAQVSGPKPAAAVFARAIRLRNGGPEMDALADIIEPPEYKKKDGQEPPDPQMMAMQGEVQRLTGLLQQAEQEKQAKIVEQQGKFATAKMQEDAETARDHEANQVKVFIAGINDKLERLTAALTLNDAERVRVHEHQEAVRERAHQAATQARDHAFQRVQTQAGQANDAEMAELGQAHVLEQGQQAAALAPQPEAGA